MTFKEFSKKYKDYNIKVYGKPLNKPTTPFTFLPQDKELNDCEVVDYEIKNEELTTHGYDFKKAKWFNEKLKGSIKVYVK